MVTLICQVELRIFESNSLKEKRSVIKSTIEKVKNKNNISIIESDYNDLWQKSKIGISYSSMSSVDANKKLESIINIIEINPYIEIINIEKEEVYS